MQKNREKVASGETAAHENAEARGERRSNGKQAYEKPRLTKHEQLHGIGLGS